MPRKIKAQKGRRKFVHWAPREKDLRGVFCDCPKKIPREAIGQFQARINCFLKSGRFPHDPEKYKPVEDGLYELKAWKYRIIGYYEDDWSTFVAVLCVFKNQNDLDPSDVKKAHQKARRAKEDLEYIE